MTIDKKRIAEEAQHFFEWPDPKHRDSVTLTSCVIFAATIAEVARAEEKARCIAACKAMKSLEGDYLARVLAGAHEDASARRLQNALKALLRKG